MASLGIKQQGEHSLGTTTTGDNQISVNNIVSSLPLPAVVAFAVERFPDMQLVSTFRLKYEAENYVPPPSCHEASQDGRKEGRKEGK